MSSSFHPLNLMLLFTILSALICTQLLTVTSSEIIDESPSEQWNALLQSEANLDDLSNSENEEDIENVRRANTFLRFGRAMSPNSATFLRFGRQMSPTSGSFLRFGRSNLPSTLLGRGGHQGAAFLRFGRRAANLPSSNFHRFARKGEFLRFG